jgi:hypothetical protein
MKMIREKKCSDSSCLSVKLSNRIPTWHSLGQEPDFRDERPETNCLKLGTAMKFIKMPTAVRLV